MYSPPCCLNDGSIWFLKLFTVLLFTVSSLSLFQVSTTRCVKKYFRTFSLQCSLRMVREWPLRPVAVRSWKKSSRFTPSKLCIILNTLIKSLLSRLISSESSFVFDSLTLYSSSPIPLIILVILLWTCSLLFDLFSYVRLINPTILLALLTHVAMWWLGLSDWLITTPRSFSSAQSSVLPLYTGVLGLHILHYTNVCHITVMKMGNCNLIYFI